MAKQGKVHSYYLVIAYNHGTTTTIECGFYSKAEASQERLDVLDSLRAEHPKAKVEVVRCLDYQASLDAAYLHFCDSHS